MAQRESAGGVLGAIDRAHDVLSQIYFKYQRKIGPFASQALGAARSLTEARATLEPLVEAADRVAATLEMPTLCRQSTKNANAGFIDWRDWCALLGEVNQLRLQLAAYHGSKESNPASGSQP